MTHSSPFVRAKIVRKTNSAGKSFTIARVTETGGDVPSDPEGLHHWMFYQKGFINGVLLCADRNDGWLIVGATEAELAEFKPFSELDWWEEIFPKS